MKEANSNLVFIRPPFNIETKFNYDITLTIASALNFIAYWENYYQKDNYLNICLGMNKAFQLTHDLLEADMIDIKKRFKWAFEKPIENKVLNLEFNLENLDYMNAIAAKHIEKELHPSFIIDFALNTYIQSFLEFANIITKNPKCINKITLEEVLAYGFNDNLSDIRRRALNDNKTDILTFLKESYQNRKLKIYFGNSQTFQNDWLIGY